MASTLYPRGSEWRKWDLHFHTPSSYDYKDKSITNEHIIDVLAANSISVVAITDHHIIDIDRITKLQQLGREKEITVLPGIEFLSEARGREHIHFIAIFSPESNLQFIWGQLQHKTALSEMTATSKEPNEIYCDLAETIQLVKDLGGIVTIHAGGKSNSIENITHSLPHGEAQKKDIALAVDIFEMGKEEDQAGYRKYVFPTIKKNLPMIIASDNHNINQYQLKQNCWIKADPNFEGLKQIIHEPEERVRIQASQPEDKAGYQVIDNINVRSKYIHNSQLLLNANLNSVIGGRSAGKSILLAAIAKKLKTDKPVRFEHNLEYDEFVADISQGLTIIWKDGEENNEREIEYFEQGYMHDLARKEDKLSKLIQDILKQKGKESLLTSYDRFISENKKHLSDLINDLYRNLQEIREKQQKVSDKGDKKGIEDEIARLREDLNKLSTTEISEEEKNVYGHYKDIIVGAQRKQASIGQDIGYIEALKDIQLFKSNISFELTSITEERKKRIESLFNQLKESFTQSWQVGITELIKEAKSLKEATEKEIKEASQNEVYGKVLAAFQQSTQLNELEEKITIQNKKLFEITALLGDIEALKKQKEDLKQNILNAHKRYYQETISLLPSLSEATDGLEIKAKAKFNQQLYRDILIAGLNQQSHNNQVLSNYEYKDLTSYETMCISLLEKLIKGELTLKGGYTSQSLMHTLFTECFYNLTYDIEFDGDDFAKMSDGKKAFVVLKLLLDFSNKDCPILIDQPEDDLDNRAIYLDLVQYLKKKKKVRQIIVATHNPNIVVGADSESIIAANQNGIKNVNRDRKKFQYVSGSLEYTCERDTAVQEVLDCQGIREHICEILEGGNKAFKLRERKYSLPEHLEQMA